MKNIFPLLLISVLLISSCHVTKKTQPLWWANPTGFIDKTTNKSQTEKQTAFTDSSKIIIYNAKMDLTVANIDSSNNLISLVAKKYNGYVQTIGTERTIIRVKSSKLTNALNDIAQLGTVSKKELSGEDVTEQYWDSKIRLENANKARETYLGLLKKAENVEAALKVEKELERINGEIDLLEGKMQKLKHLSEFSTITVYLKTKVKPGILGYVGIGIYKSVRWLFVR